MILGKTPKQKPVAFAGVQHPIPKGAALSNVPSLYEQVELTGCEAAPQGWKAVGTARNDGAGRQELEVLVFFTDERARVVDSAAATVSVPAGSTRTWTAERKFEKPPGTKCVVRAVSRAN